MDTLYGTTTSVSTRASAFPFVTAAKVSLVQNPTASGARLEVSVRSRLKVGSKCRIDTLRWNEGQGVFVTASTTILTVTSRGPSLLQSHEILGDRSTFQVNASSCGVTDAIPVGDYTTCFISGFESDPRFSSPVTLSSVSGNGRTIVVSVKSADIESPTRREQATDRDCRARDPAARQSPLAGTGDGKAGADQPD